MARILQLHNEYLQLGGEDGAVQDEYNLLVSRGHEVRQFIVRNKDVDTLTIGGKTRLAIDAVWSTRFTKEILETIQEFKPQIAHVHNTFPLLSPNIYRLLKKSGCFVVTTLHNYRFICAAGTFTRSGCICTDCLDGSRIHAIQHACYRQSRIGSTAIVVSSALHSALNTFSKCVDRYIALNRCARDHFIQFGLPSEKIRVKNNFVTAAPASALGRKRVNRILFAGRLSREKGVDRLLEAWRGIDCSDWQLTIAGGGPDAPILQSRFSDLRNVNWLGHVPRDEIIELCSTSKWLIVSSRWYEQTPIIAIEAMSVGTPILVPDLGAMPDLVLPEPTGVVFSDSDPQDLREKLTALFTQDETEWNEMSKAALHKASTVYSPEENYRALMSIYELEDPSANL